VAAFVPWEPDALVIDTTGPHEKNVTAAIAHLGGRPA